MLNDASSLIVFRFALATVMTGQFLFQHAALSFLIVIAMGILVGLVVGAIFYAIHRSLATTTAIEIVLTLVTPYCMYYFAEHFHFSGVLAVVSGGLFLSSKRQTLLTFRSRIQGINVWTNLVFVLNGLIFLLIGLQLRSIIRQLGDISLARAIWYGLAVSFVLILTRVFCTLGASLFTRFVSRFITVADPNPGWRGPLILGWAGMRGVVSLAAALSVPILLTDGQPFPYRSLILFITFIFILATLVFQGLTLPWLIRTLKPEDRQAVLAEPQQELLIQKKIAQASIQFLEERYGEDRLPNEYVSNLHARLRIDLRFFDGEDDEGHATKETSLQSYQAIYLELLEQQRRLLNELNRLPEFDEDLIRKYLSLVDLEEFKVREKQLQ